MMIDTIAYTITHAEPGAESFGFAKPPAHRFQFGVCLFFCCCHLPFTAIHENSIYFVIVNKLA